MKRTISIDEFARDPDRALQHIQAEGPIILTRAGEPIAQLSSVFAELRLRNLPALLHKLPHLSKEEAAAFAEDLQDLRRESAIDPLRDPWAS